MTHSQTLNELATALSIAQGELEDASKSSKNPHFNSKYADLATILQTVRPVLSKYGLSVVQTLGFFDKSTGILHVTTMLLHKSGEFISDTLGVPLTKVDAQGIGSGATYARRYGLAAIVGISQEDDDGEAATGSTAGPAKAKAGKAKSKEVPPPTMTADELVKAFETVTAEDMPKLAPAFASLPAEDQTKVLPAVKAARARLGL